MNHRLFAAFSIAMTEDRSVKRRTFLTGTAAAGFALALAPLTAIPALAAKPEIFTGLVEGVAVGGFDPVAYFVQGMPVAGDETITLEHGGATWRFSSEENRALFAADPGKYAPKYGGYCSYAAASGYTAKGDPEAWNIVDGRLYLNYSKGVRKRWERDIPGNITKADANWPGILQ